MDELGPPWPKHKCSDYQPQRKPTLQVQLIKSKSPLLSKQKHSKASTSKPALKTPPPGRVLKQCPLCASQVRIDRLEKHLREKHPDRHTRDESRHSPNRDSVPSAVSCSIPSHATNDELLRPTTGSRKNAGALLDKQGRRRCDYCTAMVEPIHYDAHLAKVHKKSEPAEHSDNRVILTIEGLNNSRAALSEGDLCRLPSRSIRGLHEYTPVNFSGVLLSDALALVVQPSGDEFVGSSLDHYVLVENRQNERALFAWAEVDQSLTERNIYLALKVDGHALPCRSAPIQLLVPADKRRGRWLGQVALIRIKRAD